LVLARWSRRRLGGVTGDVFGASAELAETLSLAAVAAV
jgi:cobalamin synthase